MDCYIVYINECNLFLENNLNQISHYTCCRKLTTETWNIRVLLNYIWHIELIIIVSHVLFTDSILSSPYAMWIVNVDIEQKIVIQHCSNVMQGHELKFDARTGKCSSVRTNQTRVRTNKVLLNKVYWNAMVPARAPLKSVTIHVFRQAGFQCGRQNKTIDF
jgi:hypothetical protein